MKKQDTSEPIDVMSDWEDELFDDFVSNADGHEESHDAPIVQLGALKSALAMLQAGDSSSIAEEQSSDDEVELGLIGDLAEETSSVDLEQEFLEPAQAPSRPPRKGIKSAKLEMIECPELTAAFLEDTSRGIAALDQAVIDYESNSQRGEALSQICRELHTLKGASAIVGLTDISRYLHDIEDFVEDNENSANEISQVLRTCVATIRSQAAKLSAALNERQQENDSEETPQQNRITAGSEGEDAICVKGEQLDRLLDMVTALTMLNNQRDTHVDQLRTVHANISQCGNRIRDLDRTLSNATFAEHSLDVMPSISNSMREISNDLGEIGKLLRDSYSPITQEHLAVANFIRQFRTALVSILRMPVSGLFRRLQRSALDAARVERKQVRLEVIGSESGLERSVQERLLDPLMHIVRNAVSHGIETPEERKKLGKDPVGTVTFEAISSPNLLTINVQDDGRGLDYEALRKRGTQLGLLQTGRNATEQELGQLIFQPGFSTRDNANEVAGRGIGMDVVVDTLEKMHAWVEVDSVPGKGATITLSVPLKSITDHALIVRVGEYLAALPMQYVRRTDDSDDGDTTEPSLADVLGIPASNSASCVVSLESNQSRVKGGLAPHIACRVDEILGPQEVVVRPLPPLLRFQPLLAGVTLTATGDVVYVLDSRRLASAIEEFDDETCQPISRPINEDATVRLLVVDDSLSARSAVSMFCRERGWEVSEAQNGLVAMELLDQEDWTAVITDFDMPQMDGLQFIESLRRRDSMKNVPVLMVSSRPASDMERKAKSAGATKYVTKPWTADLLDEFVRQNARPHQSSMPSTRQEANG